MSRVQKIIEEFKDLFVCRTDAFASGYRTATGKVAYPPARDDEGNDLPLTEDDLYAHLSGKKIVGIYPLVSKNNDNVYDHCKWIALDFDQGEDPIGDAIKQKNVFLENGIISYVERSQSGNGAHLWVFFDELIPASFARMIVKEFLIEAASFDRMFPNQDKSIGTYGNLIALPYQGESFKAGNTSFVDDQKNTVSPPDFLESVVRNRVSYLKTLEYTKKNVESTRQAVASSVASTSQPRNLSGGMKLVLFSEWIKKAKERMPNQNQEPEFYALCCQFAQLEDGERLAYEFGRLHPYSDERIKEKFEQAKKVNMPHTCRTLREEFGFESYEDIEYGVTYPYEIASIPFSVLLGSKKGELHSFGNVLEKVVGRAKDFYKRGERPGWSYGYDSLDDLTDIRKGNLIVFGARSGIGKTSFAIAESCKLAKRGIPVYWASLEMAKEELALKLISNLASIDSKDIMHANLSYKQWRRLFRAQKQFAELPIFIDDQTKDINKMLDNIGMFISNNGPGLVIVDYLELVAKEGKGENLQSLSSRVVVELKGLAKMMDLPIMLLSNFNRKAEGDLIEGQKPQDSWLRNSGLIEQTADVVLYLLGDKGTGIVRREVWVQKERFMGSAGKSAILWFDQKHSSFSEEMPGTRVTGITSKVTIDRSNIDVFNT